MMKRVAVLILALAAIVLPGTALASSSGGKSEWELIEGDYKWLDTLRQAAPAPPPTASRKESIELYLQNEKKVEQVYGKFIEKLEDYYHRTGDPRAAALFAKEKIRIGDGYMNVLARYDRAINMYRAALYVDPDNEEAKAKLAIAEAKRFVSPEAFAKLKEGMKESDVQQVIGLPREDWIRQKIENERVYSVWIYPRKDGGAAAVYFEGGVVYHRNWNAAPAPVPVQEKSEAN